MEPSPHLVQASRFQPGLKKPTLQRVDVPSGFQP
jgi:hypothetical protein